MTPPAVVADGVDQLDPVYMRTQADYYFSVGEALSLEGNHQKAVESFKMVLIYDPESPQVYLRLSAEYVKIGLLTQALENAESAVEKDPKFVDAHLLLGGLYSTLKVYDKAFKEYETVLKLDPKNSEAPLYMGALYAEQKQYDKAVGYFQRLGQSENFSTPYLAWYYVGRIRTEQGGKAHQTAAEAAFKKALQAKPDHVESVLALGSLYAKMSQTKKAVDLYQKFQREYGPNPRLAEILAQNYLEDEQYELAAEQLQIVESYSDDALNAKLKLSLIYIEQKKYSQAIAKLKDVLQQVPDSDKIRFYLAAIYEEINQRSDAIDHFQQIPAASQYYGEAVVHAAYLLKQDKQVDEALALVSKALEKRDDVPQFYAVQASLLDEKGQYHQAAELLTKGSKKFPDNVQLRFFLGTMQDRLGDKQQVVESMKQVLEMDPNHVQGLNYLAFTYAESDKNLEEAEGLVRRALSIEPKDGYVLDTLGWILYKKGKFQDSVKVLESAHRYQPNESIIAEHLGDAYRQNRLVDKARVMYQKAADAETDQNKVREIRAKITSLSDQEMHLSGRKPASDSAGAKANSPRE
ncbi:MAG: hypothetical protein COT73_07875 [Bdellovibrio sp. CG10_big_fil_rev_8_21_14_0_10_47_8]|nr:MAG: hypothetical protein COT73_07875 [Bdellovibrio sp. CG10_big_fil_rev_8_21_14_0_10_47_8]